jgi:hypothetical protein
VPAARSTVQTISIDELETYEVVDEYATYNLNISEHFSGKDNYPILNMGTLGLFSGVLNMEYQTEYCSV